MHDTFEHNTRSELVNAQVNGGAYTYAYDNIGNRESAQEAAEDATQYTSNELNQYTAVGDFTPQFDAAGNQTLVKTSTGIWQVAYNAENRPVRFESEDGSTVVQCGYDYMGRRCYKKITTNGKVTLHQRYIYRGYLQITCCDLTRAATPCIWLLLWDPTQPTATRPLAIQKDSTWYTYGWDLTKNVCEIYGSSGYIRTLYTYTPYGAVSAEGDVTQPIQWSSEYLDHVTGLVGYISRYLNPEDGKWLCQDNQISGREYNVYAYVNNSPIMRFDIFGHKGSSNYNNPVQREIHRLTELGKKTRIRANQELKAKVSQNSSSSYPMCWKERNCITFTLIAELGDPTDMIIKRKIGHIGMALGQDFIDFGPQTHKFYSKGGKYWEDPNQNTWGGIWGANSTHNVTLDDIRNNANQLSPNSAVVQFTTCICKEKKEQMEAKMREYQGGNYSITGIQCASSVASAYFNSNAEEFDLWSPNEVLDYFISNVKIECGKGKGNQPHIKILKEFDINYKWIDK